MSGPTPPTEVAQVFSTYPPAARARLYELRSLLLATAGTIDGVGPITETLKWGEPSYLTEQSKSGTTIRLGWKPADPGRVAFYVNCQTTLVDSYRSLFPELQCEGNRAVTFDISEALPQDLVRTCMGMALTYHRDKRRR